MILFCWYVVVFVCCFVLCMWFVVCFDGILVCCVCVCVCVVLCCVLFVGGLCGCVVVFLVFVFGVFLNCFVSTLAQRKRVGLITQRSLDRDQQVLSSFYLFAPTHYSIISNNKHTKRVADAHVRLTLTRPASCFSCLAQPAILRIPMFSSSCCSFVAFWR